MSILRAVGHNLIDYDIFGGGGGNLGSAQGFSGFSVVQKIINFVYNSEVQHQRRYYYEI